MAYFLEYVLEIYTNGIPLAYYPFFWYETYTINILMLYFFGNAIEMRFEWVPSGMLKQCFGKSQCLMVE